MFRSGCAIFLLALLTFFGASQRASGQEDNHFVAVDPPQPLPAFLFDDDRKHTLDLTQFRGRYVLLNLWATFCLPCVAEMPTFNQLGKKLDPKKWAVIALNEDHDGESAAAIFFKHHAIDHLAVYVDTAGRAPFVLRTRGLPTTLLIDPQGREIARLEGPTDWSKETMAVFLEEQARR